MLTDSWFPDELDIVIVDVAFYVEDLYQFAGFFNELLVVVVGEEDLEESGFVYPLLHLLGCGGVNALFAEGSDVRDALELPLEVRAQDHLQGQFQLQLDLPRLDILIVVSMNGKIDDGHQEVADMMLMEIF